MGVIGPGLNRFYKKADANTTRDTNLSGVFKDVFDGNTTTAKISGVQDPQYYLSDIVIPDSPSFGNSELVGMKQYYFPTNVDISDKNYLPGAKLWKSNAHIGENNEGTLTVNKRNLTVITANQDISVPWVYDIFNNGNTSVETVRGSTSTTVFKTGLPYITIDDALTYQNNDLSRSDMIERYAEPLSTATGEQQVIYVTKKRQLGNSFATSGGFLETAIATTLAVATAAVGFLFSWAGGAVTSTGAAATITYAEEWTPASGQDFWEIDVYFKNLPESKLKYAGETTQTGEDSKATAINSDFSKTVVNRVDSHGNKPVFDDDGNHLFTATGIFSPKKYLNGGQSLKLTTYWDKSIIPTRNSSSEYIHSRYMGLTNFVTKDRQEVKAVIEIPTRGLNIDTAGSSTMRIGDIGHSNFSLMNNNGTLEYLIDNAYGYTWPAISTDMFIDEISPLFRAKSNAHNTETGTTFAALSDCAWLRGMAITFSRSKPTEDESFYQFMVRTTSASKSVDLAVGQDRRNHADSLDDASQYGTACGIIIGKIPINFASEGLDAKYNNDKQFIPDYPTMAIPFGNKTDTYTTTSSNRWRTNNLNDKVDGDGACFHESSRLGNTVWYDATRLPTNGVVLDEKAWYNFRFDIGPEYMNYIIRDSKTGEAVTKKNIALNKTSYTQGTAPRYMTIWNFNFPGAGLYSTDPDDFAMNGLGHTDDNGVMDFDTGNTLYVDNIAMAGFNHSYSNSTVSYNNPSRGKINISPTTTTTLALDTEDNIDNFRSVPSNTYVSFGFDTLADFDRATSGAQHNLWFNGIESSSLAEALHHDSSDLSIRAGFTSTSSAELIGCQATHSFFEYKATPTDGDSVNGKYKGLSTLGVTNRGLDFSGPTQLDNFSKKGAVVLHFNSQTANLGTDVAEAQAAPAKRENIFTSAKILDFTGASSGQVLVDNSNLFNLDDDCDYVIYLGQQQISNSGLIANTYSLDWNDAPTNEFGLVAKVINRDGNLITFDKDLTITGLGHTEVGNGTKSLDAARIHHPLCSNKYRNILYISPLKYWITLEIKSTGNVAGTRAIQRTYETVCMVNQGTTPPASSDYGATFSESTYTDAGNYLKGWKMQPSIDNSMIETQTDYGNGKMDIETGPNSGFIDKIVVEEDAESMKKWLVFDSSPVIKEDRMKSGDIFTSLISGMNPLSKSTVTIATNESTDKIVDYNYGSSNTMRPMTLAIFEDSVPTISDFSVSPNDNNPFYPEFSWKCTDDDVWYGFLIIDTEIPSHQYHKSSLHAPMWRPLPSSENPGMNWPPSNTDSSMDVIDYYNDESYPYGYYRNANSAHGTRANQNIRPSKTTDAGTHERGDINDYTTFLDPEGLSGWCHNFDGAGDKIILFAPEHSGSPDDEGSINGNQSSIVMHIRPDKYPDNEMGLFFSGGAGGIDLTMNSSGKIIAKFYYSTTGFVELMSHSVAPKNGNPTNIIVTFDKDLTHGNCKLFINGKLEDQSGKVLSTGSSTRWYTNARIKNYKSGGFGYLWSLGSGGGGIEFYDGKMEEFVYYPHVIYPINPADGTFTWSKPVADIDDNGKPISYFARLFVKDYHNIRGTSIKEVAMSSTLTVHKAGVEL